MERAYTVEQAEACSQIDIGSTCSNSYCSCQSEEASNVEKPLDRMLRESTTTGRSAWVGAAAPNAEGTRNANPARMHDTRQVRGMTCGDSVCFRRISGLNRLIDKFIKDMEDPIQLVY